MQTFRSSAVGFKKALVLVVLMLGVPAAYFAISLRGPRPVQAGAQPRAASSQVATLEQKVQAEPTVENRINLSQAYIQDGRYGQASELLKKLVVEAPTNAIAWNNLCVAHMMQQELNLAIDACQSGVHSDANFQLVRNNLKWAEDERTKTVAAVAEQEKTAPAQRTSAFYLAEGMNLLHLGSYDQAIAAWQRALAVEPNNAVAYNNIGTAQMLQGRYTEAEASFRQAGSLDPGNTLMRNNLAWAKSMQPSGR